MKAWDTPIVRETSSIADMAIDYKMEIDFSDLIILSAGLSSRSIFDKVNRTMRILDATNFKPERINS
jgi:hypothetical protein